SRERRSGRDRGILVVVTGNFLHKLAMLRRRAALSIRMNALIRLKPSESEMKSLISAIDNALPLEPCGADGFGAPSKKNATCCNRLAPMDMLGAPLSASALGGIRLQSDRLDD